MQPPERVAVPTCIGCGAMSQFGTCDTGCSEHKLELVRAAAYDELLEEASDTQTRIAALDDVLRQIADQEPRTAEIESAYRSAQRAARDALPRQLLPEPNRDDDQPAEHATTWWCAECGGIDAPQPCLGICVWRPVEWVNRSLYMPRRARILDQRARAQQTRDLLRRLAYVTPREGHWQHGWQLIQHEAREHLAALA